MLGQDNPFADLIPSSPQQAPAPARIYGAPKQPDPDEQRRLALAERSAERGDAAAQRANDAAARTATAAQTTANNTTFDNVSTMRKEFTGRKEVQDFQTILPQVATAMQIAKNPNATGADDLNLIYTFGKVMDPGSVVREGELALASDTGGFAQNIQAAITKLQNGEKLPPAVRRNLVESMRRRGVEMAHAYQQSRNSYKSLAERNGLNPIDIVGDHPARPFQQAEADFTGQTIGNLDGGVGARPKGYQPKPEGDVVFNDQAPDTSANSYRLKPEQEAAVAALAQSGASAEAISSLVKKFGGDASPESLKSLQTFYADPKNRNVAPGQDYGEVDKIKPVDIGDGAFGAGMRGFGDTASVGFLDEAGALIDTVAKGGTYADNLDRNRGILLNDEQKNGGARIAGQLAGGLVLPSGGARTAAELGRVGAGYGAAYGFGSSNGNFGDRLTGAGVGAATGGAAGYGLGALGNLAASRLGGRTPPTGRGAVDQEVVDAAERQGVELVRPDVQASRRSTYGFLETLPFAGGRVRSDLQRGADQIEAKVGALGGGTAVPRPTAGEGIRDSAERYVERSKTVVDRLYDRAATTSGNAQITATQALSTLDGHIAQLSQTPSTNATKLGVLNQIRNDLVDDAGNLRPLSIQAIRDIRTGARDELGAKGLRFSDTERRITDAIDSASQDIRAQLSGPGLRAYDRADRAYRERADLVDNVIEKFIGADRNARLSGEKVMAKIESASAPRSGDAATLNRLMSRLEPAERDQAASSIAATLGRRAIDGDNAFSPNQFFSQVQKYSEESRVAIFGAQGARDIADLARISEARAGTLGQLNNSRSGQVGNWYQTVKGVLTGGGVGGGIGFAAGASTLGAVAGAAVPGLMVGAATLTARALGNKKVISALAQAARATTPTAQQRTITYLGQIASRQPQIANDILPIREALQRAISSSAAGDEPPAGQVQQRR